MNIEFQSRNFDLDDDIRTYAQRKLQKVTRFLEEPAEIRVTLQGTKHGQVADLEAGLLDSKPVFLHDPRQPADCPVHQTYPSGCLPRFLFDRLGRAREFPLALLCPL